MRENTADLRTSLKEINSKLQEDGSSLLSTWSEMQSIKREKALTAHLLVVLERSCELMQRCDRVNRLLSSRNYSSALKVGPSVLSHSVFCCIMTTYALA